MKKITVNVKGMTCNHCKMHVENAIKSLNGVSDVKVSLEEGKADITYDPAKVTLDDIKAVVDDAGYEVVA
ncbi:MAG: copper chaperone CopZ [Thermoanaerobacteraceae bacterium]|nr:copper chaperone CopZ [Thermoanaerobacteraceae bacterium]